jgi:hypothetical protein
MPPFKDDDWNAVIKQVNGLIANGCTGSTKLQEVGKDHIWSVDDIRAVRNTLATMCSNKPGFSVPTVKWTQKIIDELNTVIAHCECQKYPYAIQLPGFSLPLVGATVTTSGSSTMADGQILTEWTDTKTTYSLSTPLQSLFDGTQVGPAGISGRTFQAFLAATWYEYVSNNGVVQGSGSWVQAVAVQGTVDSGGICHGSSSTNLWTWPYSDDQEVTVTYYPDSPNPQVFSGSYITEYLITGCTAYLWITK